MQKQIAVLYNDSDFISKDKTKVKDYLMYNLGLKLKNDRNKIEYNTEKVIIYWVDTTKRNLDKFFEKNDPDVVISVVNKKYWELRSLFEEIKKELNNIYEEITVYRVVYNYDNDRPSYEIKEIKTLENNVRHNDHLSITEAMDELCYELENINAVLLNQIKQRQKKIDESKNQIDMNNRFLKNYYETL